MCDKKYKKSTVPLQSDVKYLNRFGEWDILIATGIIIPFKITSVFQVLSFVMPPPTALLRINLHIYHRNVQKLAERIKKFSPRPDKKQVLALSYFQILYT